MLDFDPEKFIEHIDQSKYETNLDQLLAETPSLMAFYGAKGIEWASGVDLIKAELSFRSAEIANEFRDSFGTSKAPSQGVVDAFVESHADVRELNRKFIKCKKESGLYKNAMEALNTRASALQTISANRRSERDKSSLRSHGYVYEETPAVYGIGGTTYKTPTYYTATPTSDSTHPSSSAASILAAAADRGYKAT